jgi:hypothetical protein
LREEDANRALADVLSDEPEMEPFLRVQELPLPDHSRN